MDLKNSVQISTKDTNLQNDLETLILEAGGLYILEPDSKERPDLLIFELTSDFDEELKRLLNVLKSNMVGEVIVTSKEKDSDLLLKVMKAGIKEFLLLPLDKAEVNDALLSCKGRIGTSTNIPQGVKGKIINVIGAKGGVGTTTVAVNLATILVANDKKSSVALVDMNTLFGEVTLFLNIKPAYHLGEIVKNVKRLDTTFLMNVLSKHSSGVYVLPSPSNLNGQRPVTAEIMKNLLTLMKNTFDYVIIDGGQSLDGHSLSIIDMSEKVLLITLLNLPCLSNTLKLTKSLIGTGIAERDKIKIIANRHLKKTDISVKEAEESIQNDIFWLIPNDYKTTMSAINNGRVLNDIFPKAEITKNMSELADSLSGEGESNKKKKAKKGLFW